ncbi:helix-turn-helix domain-containing protein [Streptomyces sp. NPDC045431]|uniref:helix-turn-helix domain-containing protein n=1 Tax=Streptomyces sp. NPDC045431 TaxID=3155613 RepID=UPI0033EA7388
MLSAIGLDERQESAYRALVSLGAAEVADLAHRLALPEPDTERTLRRLESRGLAARSPVGAGRWVAAPPAVALGALLTRQRHELERAEQAAAVLAEGYRAEAAGPEAHDLVEVVTGASAVAHRLRQLRLGAAREVCALVTEPYGPGPGPGPEPDAEHASASESASAPVEYRAVVARSVLSRPDGVAGLPRAGRLRVADRLPADLVIADGTLAMVALAGGRDAEPAGLVVHASGLLDLLTALFEAVWREAVPLRPGSGERVTEGTAPGPDATDLEILSLLLAGLTDASVAKQLDLGLRTVQRRVKALMEAAGVTTRLQLGWHAYERGWVARS